MAAFPLLSIESCSSAFSALRAGLPSRFRPSCDRACSRFALPVCRGFARFPEGCPSAPMQTSLSSLRDWFDCAGPLESGVAEKEKMRDAPILRSPVTAHQLAGVIAGLGRRVLDNPLAA